MARSKPSAAKVTTVESITRLPEELEPIKKPSPYLQILSNRNFRLLWMSQALSNTGDWLIVSALIALIYGVSKSSFAIGLYFIFKIAPALFLGPFVGVLVDRLNRKHTLIICDVARGLLILSLPFMRSIYGILFITFVLETFSLLFVPAKNATIPNIVSKDNLLAANTLSKATENVTMILGLSFGATIILTVQKLITELPFKDVPVLRYFVPDIIGAQTAFIVDSLTFLFSALLIAFIAFPAHKKKRAKIGAARLKEDLTAGFNYLKQNPVLRAVLFSVGIAVLGGGSLYSLSTAYLEEVIKVDKEAVAPILALFGIGLLLGTLSSGVVGRFVSRQHLIAFSIFVFGLSLVSFASVPYYELITLFAVLAGAAVGSLSVAGYTFIHETVENGMQGRVFSALEVTIRVSLMLSLALSGIAADLIGQRVLRLDGQTLRLNGPKTVLILGGVVVVLVSFFAYRAEQKTGIV